MRTVGTHSQHTCLQASQGPGSPNLRTALSRRPVPLQLQRPVGCVASLGRAAVLATARPGTLPCEASLVLALQGKPGCLFGRLALGLAGHGYITFRRTYVGRGRAYGKECSARP